MNIILRVLIVCAGFAALAYLSGVLIRFLSRVFDVKKDERMAMLLDVLGHADCAGWRLRQLPRVCGRAAA